MTDRLDSWKAIASYLKRDVSTVQRWERREAMPVHRHLHDKQGSVFAYRSELDAWWASRRPQLTPEPATAAADQRPVRRRASPVRWALAGAVLVLMALAAWFVAGSNYFWRSPLADAKFSRLLDFTGTEQAAAISRDGKWVAFLADRDGRIDAWLTEVGSGTYRNLTDGTPREMVNPLIRPLNFSADSSQVSIWTRRPDGSQPGDVSLLAAPTAGGPLQPYLREAAEYDWSRDGRRLVYHTTAPGDPLFIREPGGLGGHPDRQLYAAPAGVHCHFPLWSPDGVFIYFVRGVPPDDWDIWRMPLSGDGLERITTHHSRVTYPVMLDRRTLLYLATDADGSGPWIYSADVEQRIPHRVSAGLESYTSLAADADGRHLVATIADTRMSLWRMALAENPGVPTAVDAPALVAPDGIAPRLAPDRLFYVAPRGAGQGIWSLAHGTSREIWSSAGSRLVGAPALSPDGKHLAFSAEHGRATRLYLMDTDGAHVRVLADSLELRGTPAWSPDGRSIVSAALRDGEPRLTRILLDGGTSAPFVSEYSIDPVWSPDGRFLVYSGADVGTTFPLRAVAADGRPYPLPSVMLTRGARRVAFYRDARTLVFLDGEIGHKVLSLLDLQNGTRRLLAELPPSFVIRDFDVSPAGSEIVVDRAQTNSKLEWIERRP